MARSGSLPLRVPSTVPTDRLSGFTHETDGAVVGGSFTFKMFTYIDSHAPVSKTKQVM